VIGSELIEMKFIRDGTRRIRMRNTFHCCKIRIMKQWWRTISMIIGWSAVPLIGLKTQISKNDDRIDHFSTMSNRRHRVYSQMTPDTTSTSPHFLRFFFQFFFIFFLLKLRQTRLHCLQTHLVTCQVIPLIVSVTW
jgi:hypothetical protein